MKALTKRKFHIVGKWYEPRRFLSEFKSVVKCELFDTTSSAGDWAGWFLQQFGRSSYNLAMFFQENSGDGFDIITDDCFIGSFASAPSCAEIEEFISTYYYYEKIDNI